MTPTETAATSENALRRAGWKWEAQTAGPYTVFFAEPAAGAPPRRPRWIGFGVLTDE